MNPSAIPASARPHPTGWRRALATVGLWTALALLGLQILLIALGLLQMPAEGAVEAALYQASDILRLPRVAVTVVGLVIGVLELVAGRGVQRLAGLWLLLPSILVELWTWVAYLVAEASADGTTTWSLVWPTLTTAVGLLLALFAWRAVKAHQRVLGSSVGEASR